MSAGATQKWLGRARRSLDKLKGRSLDELRLRVRQSLAATSEQVEIAIGRDPLSESTMLELVNPHCRNSEELLAIFHATARRTPIPGLEDITATVAALPVPAVARAIADADEIVSGRIVLFGGQLFDFGDPLDWHRDPRTGIAAPLRHWKKIDYLDPLVAGDKKLIWEINRHQYLLTLGRAYAATGDDRYATAFVADLQSWMAANPPRLGINWASALEVAYRAIAWIWALTLFRASPRLTPPLLLAVIRQLELSGRHVERHLSTYFSPNTHLTGEALGLFYLGVAMPFLPGASRWRSLGRRILAGELEKQIRPDGTYFENATYYHRYALDIFVNFAILAEASGDPVDATGLRRIEALATALAALVKPDGTHGLIGDDDGGRLLPLDPSPLNDFRPALSNAAVLLDHAGLAAAAAGLAEETIWLFGASARQRFERAMSGVTHSDQADRHAKSCALADGGLFVMRDGSGPGANHLVVDCGPHGAMNCGHAHADALAFELSSAGRSMLLDAGTFTYTGDRAARDDFRSTAYHNALTVDGQSSSVVAGPFSWSKIANCRLLHWSAGAHFDTFEGEHDGFLRLATPVACRRSIFFIKNAYWIMLDRVRSAGLHDYVQHFHFAPGASPGIVGGGAENSANYCSERAAGLSGLDIVSFSPRGTWQLRDGWISTRYADRQPSKVAMFTVPPSGSIDIVTYLMPRRAGVEGTLPRIIAAVSGKAFELVSANGDVDTFLLGADGSIGSGGFTGEADWVFGRVGGGGIRDLVAHAATRLELDGEPVLRARTPVHVELHRDGDRLVVERATNGEIEISSFGCSIIVDGGYEIETGGRRSIVLAGGR